MLKKFISYYKPYKKLFAVDMISSFLVAILGLIYPMVSRHMLNDLIPNGNIKMIVIFGAGLLIIYIIRMILRYVVQYYGHIVGVGMQADMRREMFNKLQKLPYSFYDDNETGSIMSRMTNDLMEVSELAHHGPENFFVCGLMVVGSFVYLLTIEPTLTMIIFACVPILIVVSRIYKTKMRLSFKKSRESIAEINASLASSIEGVRVTKAFTNSQKELEKFEVGNGHFVKARDRAYDAMGKFFASTSFITDVFNIIVMVSGGIFMQAGKINFADFSAFIISVNLFLEPLNTLIKFVEQYQNGVTGFNRFLEIMNQEEEQENPNAKTLQNVQGEIEFQNVNFSYGDGKEVLKNVSFTIEKGKKIALVGESGGGKTTICHLLPRFYVNDGGNILIDNINIAEVTLDSLRQNIGIVQQDVYLFNGTFKDNIMYGNQNATFEQVVESAKKANIHDFIMSQTDGYETQIGERGVRLSGGQKQRLSIARVFLKNPSILVLDEATSALDNTTEIMIQAELDELTKNRTTIIVAHRLSTVKNADEIFVVTGGEITERGSHEELIKQNGKYKMLYNAQFKSE